MNIIAALLTGLLFGLGLVISGMANPAKVQNFLDIFGTWDPSLAFVMGGAIAVAAPGFYFVSRRDRPVFKIKFSLPTRTDIDSQLLAGAAIFGVGWGLVGLCPGPAIVAAGGSLPGIFVFVGAMVAGLILSKVIRSYLATPVPT